jgi:hypothetical protein
MTSEPFGSIAQDFVVSEPSVTALAYVRSEGPNPVNGQFTIWDLQGGRNISTQFNVGPSWVLLTNTLGLTAGANRNIRIEFYLYTLNVRLLVDSVNAF